MCILAFAYNVLINDIVVCLEQSRVGETWQFAKPLELRTRDGIATFGACKVLKDGLCLRVDVVLIVLRVVVRKDTLETPHRLDVLGIRSSKFEGV